MDQHARGLDRLGNALFNRYLDVAVEADGLPARPLFLRCGQRSGRRLRWRRGGRRRLRARRARPRRRRRSIWRGRWRCWGTRQRHGWWRWAGRAVPGSRAWPMRSPRRLAGRRGRGCCAPTCCASGRSACRRRRGCRRTGTAPTRMLGRIELAANAVLLGGAAGGDCRCGVRRGGRAGENCGGGGGSGRRFHGIWLVAPAATLLHRARDREETRGRNRPWNARNGPFGAGTCLRNDRCRPGRTGRGDGYLARPEGFEPPTCRLEVCRSIQLS